MFNNYYSNDPKSWKTTNFFSYPDATSLILFEKFLCTSAQVLTLFGMHCISYLLHILLIKLGEQRINSIFYQFHLVIICIYDTVKIYLLIIRQIFMFSFSNNLGKF